MSDIFSFLITILINGEISRVAVDVKSGYLDPDDVKSCYREKGIEAKLRALVPLHIYHPKHDKGFKIIDVLRINTVVSINQTRDLQEGK